MSHRNGEADSPPWGHGKSLAIGLSCWIIELNQSLHPAWRARQLVAIAYPIGDLVCLGILIRIALAPGLRSLIGYSDLLLRDPADGPLPKVGAIREAAMRASDLTRQLLAFGRPRARDRARDRRPKRRDDRRAHSARRRRRLHDPPTPGRVRCGCSHRPLRLID
jgi:hypothetical protein